MDVMVLTGISKFELFAYHMALCPRKSVIRAKVGSHQVQYCDM
jgi:hypothetical protein